MNDLPKVVTSTMYMLADDTKLYRPISTDSDAISLQHDLNHLVRWCDTCSWQMYFNIEKCKVMSLGNATSFNDYFMVRNNVDLTITCV